MSRTLRRAVFLCLAALLAPALRAQEASPAYDPFFLGYETEPGMDYGGRTLSSVQSAIGRAIGSLPHVDRHPGLAPAWEFPIGAFLTVVQHEVDGHGGRAREFGLGPSYGFGFDFSGYTTTRLAPATHTENMLIGTAGVESDGMMARRILLDALRPEGTDGAKIPLAFMGKLDLSLYVSEVRRPASDAQRFVDQYRQGNDMAFYLVARQAARRGARPADA